MANERLQHTAITLSYVLAGFVVLTGVGLVHHAYWVGAGVAGFVAMLALPPISRRVLAAVGGATAVSTTIYALALLAGVTTMFVFVEAERDRRHEEYWSQREAIVERARTALAEERYDAVQNLAARYDHVGDNQLADLAGQARERFLGQQPASTAGADENAAPEGSEDDGASEPRDEDGEKDYETMYEKLKRQNQDDQDILDP
jgi:uncharacterized membrane protein YuzA (DUF378 family)